MEIDNPFKEYYFIKFDHESQNYTKRDRSSSIIVKVLKKEKKKL